MEYNTRSKQGLACVIASVGSLLMRERAGLVEHPLGTLKRRAGWDHFRVRGLDKVRGEWSLMAWAYNFTRVLNIVGMEKFKAACA